MRTIFLLIAMLVCPLAAQAGQRTTEQRPRSPAELPPVAVALGMTNSFHANALMQYQAPAWDLAGNCYVWQQPGVALTITSEWTNPETMPEFLISPDITERFFTAQSNMVNAAPFHYPGEAEYGSDDPAIDDMVCLLWATDAAERYARHLAGYRQWIGYNPGMDFIEPREYAEPYAAVVFIHSGGAVEFYFGFDANGEIRLMHLMSYDYFSA